MNEEVFEKSMSLGRQSSESCERYFYTMALDQMRAAELEEKKIRESHPNYPNFIRIEHSESYEEAIQKLDFWGRQLKKSESCRRAA